MTRIDSEQSTEDVSGLEHNQRRRESYVRILDPRFRVNNKHVGINGGDLFKLYILKFNPDGEIAALASGG